MNRLLIFSLALLFLTNLSLSAQIRIFTGNDQSDEWHDVDNWEDGIIPGPFDKVLIDGSSELIDTVKITMMPVELQSLELRNSVVLLNKRQMTFNNSDTFAIKASSSSTILNQGTIIVEEAGDATDDNAIDLGFETTLINDSLIFIENATGKGITLTNADLVNQGVIHVESGRSALYSTSSDIINADSMFLTCLQLNPLRLNSNTVTTNLVTGTMDIRSSTAGYPSIYLVGSLFNSGEIITKSRGTGLFIRSGAIVDHAGMITLEEETSLGVHYSLRIEDGGMLFTHLGANITILATIDNDPIEVEFGGILDCQGSLEVVGSN